MRRIFSTLLATVVIVLSFIPLTACKSQATTAAPSTTDQRYSPPLTLEQAEQQIKETGSTFVDTVEKASKLTGYPVATPAFVPDGFAPRVIVNSSSFNIYQIGFNAPRPGTPVSQPPFPYDVQQTYAQTQGRLTNEPFFMITQSRNNIGIAGDKQPVDIGGHPGEKSLIPASGNSSARLTFNWINGTMHYVMMGTLTGPLDEATLIKVAASMRVP
jgi:hypothetical protein